MQNFFTKKKFLKLDHKQRHKKCAELLCSFYEALHSGDLIKKEDLSYYNSLLSWIQCNSYHAFDLKSLADRYHWHLKEAGKSLKEHNLLPHIRKGDHEPKQDFFPIAIYLDNLRSAYNVGSILRTMEALRIGHLYFSEKTPFIDNDKVKHTSMGASEFVPCFQNVPLSSLPKPLIALETSDDAISVSSFIFPPAFTLILGNEEVGVSDEVLSEIDIIIEIPLFGAKNSINVASAFAIAAQEIRKQNP